MKNRIMGFSDIKRARNIYFLIAIFIFIFMFVSVLFSEEIEFEKIIIGSQFIEASDVSYADFDGDNDLDIIACSYQDGIMWWKNLGENIFGDLEFDEGNSIVESNDAYRSLRSIDHEGNPVDFNNDGFYDFATVCIAGSRVEWWQNDGEGNFTVNVLDSLFQGAHTVDVQDVNQDGLMDILASGTGWGRFPGVVSWWENNGNSEFSKHEIADNYEFATFVYAVDVDNDDDIDVLTANYEYHPEGGIFWWENDGENNFVEEHVVINSSFVGSHTVLAKDIDDDEDLDILAAAYNTGKFTWFENKLVEDEGLVSHSLDDIDGAIWLDAADLNNDGFMDLIGNAENAHALISDVVWWPNDGENNFDEYYTLSTDIGHAYCTIPADIDGDDDIDLLTASNSTNEIILWNNYGNVNDTEDAMEVGQVLSFYPNPFYMNSEHRTSGNIKFISSETANYSIDLFNIKGQKISNIFFGELSKGYNEINWKTSQGKEIGNGVYLISVSSKNSVVALKKITIIK